MQFAWTECRQAFEMLGRGIPLVGVEVIVRESLVVFAHQAVPADLREDGGGRPHEEGEPERAGREVEGAAQVGEQDSEGPREETEDAEGTEQNGKAEPSLLHDAPLGAGLAHARAE